MDIVTRSLRSSVVLMAGLLFGAGVALAQSQTPTPDAPPPGAEPHMRPHMEEVCKTDPQKCEQMKQRMEAHRAACAKDPEACKKEHEEHKAKMEERRKEMKAECDKDPVACKQKREEMHKKFEERCKADPQKCEEWKKQHPHPNHPPIPGDKPADAPPPVPQAAQ